MTATIASNYDGWGTISRRNIETGKARRFEWFFVILVPLWLFGLIFPGTTATENRELLQLATLIWPIPFCLHFGGWYFLYCGLHRASHVIRLFTVIFVSAYVASALLSVDPLFSIGYAAVTTAGLICCAGLWSCISRRMELALAIYSIIGSAFAAYAYWDGNSLQGRLTFGATGHPNLLAFVSFGVLVCSLAVRLIIVRLALISINALVIIETQGRSCLLASAISIVVFVALVIGFRGRHRLLILAALLIVALATGVMYQQEIHNAVSTLLFLDDPSRGVGTGFTGRLDAWAEAYRLFLDNPVFGIGFRTHERYMTALPTAHNGFLSMLAETGLAGFCSILILIGACMWRLLKIARTGDRTAILGFAFVAGYLFVAMFERILVNFGSPTSVLMWVFLFIPRWPRSVRDAQSLGSGSQVSTENV